jgi:hypothetical protein
MTCAEKSGAAHHLAIAGDPVAGCRERLRSGDHRDPAVPGRDQVLGERDAALTVVRDDRIVGAVIGVPQQLDDRDAFRRLDEIARAGRGRGHVDDRVDPELLERTQIRAVALGFVVADTQQEPVAALFEGTLQHGRALGVEVVADVGDDQPDRHRMLRPQRPRERIRPVAEGPGGGHDLGPRRVVDVALPAQGARHRRRGEPGAGGDIAQRCHGPAL